MDGHITAELAAMGDLEYVHAALQDLDYQHRCNTGISWQYDSGRDGQQSIIVLLATVYEVRAGQLAICTSDCTMESTGGVQFLAELATTVSRHCSLMRSIYAQHELEKTLGSPGT